MWPLFIHDEDLFADAIEVGYLCVDVTPRKGDTFAVFPKADNGTDEAAWRQVKAGTCNCDLAAFAV